MRAGKSSTFVLGAALGGLVCSPADAAAAPLSAKPVTVEELVVVAPTMISELTVTAAVKCLGADRMANPGSRPKVVSSFPAKGAVVRPGLLILRLTFDKPMACSGRVLAHLPWLNPCPDGPQDMLLSYDRRTVRTACAAGPDAHYGVSLNRELDGDAFMGQAGLPAETFGLDFTTSSEPAVGSVCEALAQDAETTRQLEQRHRKLDCAPAPPAG